MASKNRGTGAGGSNTNRNGLRFERCICPSSPYIVGKGAKLDGDVLFLKQNDFIKYMNEHMKPVVNENERRFKPDGAYIIGDEVILLECKYQCTPGSADEKILNSPTKLDVYKMQYPRVKRWKFILVLSEWFQQEQYKRWLEVLREKPDILVRFAERTDEVIVKLEIDEERGTVKTHLTNYQFIP